jgi:hypothetical protein
MAGTSAKLNPPQAHSETLQCTVAAEIKGQGRPRVQVRLAVAPTPRERVSSQKDPTSRHLPQAQLVMLSCSSPQDRQIQTVRTAKGSLCSQSQRWALSLICSVMFLHWQVWSINVGRRPVGCLGWKDGGLGSRLHRKCEELFFG